MGRALKPHSEEWFRRLAGHDPSEAALIRRVLTKAGTLEACSMCGRTPSKEYELPDVRFEDGDSFTVRLCARCASFNEDVMLPFSTDAVTGA
jgi:hypothetical protein